MSDTCQSELKETFHSLSERVADLRKNHEYLRKVRTQLSQLVVGIFGEARSLPSESESRDVGDSCSDLLELINGNCSENPFNHCFAEESYQFVEQDESYETPCFRLKHRESLYNEGINPVERFVDPLRGVMFVCHQELCWSYEIDPLFLGEATSLSMLCSPYIFALNNIDSVIATFQRAATNSVTNDQDGHRSESVNDIVFNQSFYVDLAEQSRNGEESCYTDECLVENYLGLVHINSTKDSKSVSSDHFYAPNQWTNIRIEGIETTQNKRLMSGYKRAQKSECLMFPELMTLQGISTQPSSCPPKRIRIEYVYQKLKGHVKIHRNVEWDLSSRNGKSNKGKGKHELAFPKSWCLRSLRRHRSFTASEKQWLVVLKKSFSIVYRNIILELFQLNTYSKPKVTPNRIKIDFYERLQKIIDKCTGREEQPKKEERMVSHVMEDEPLSSATEKGFKLNCVNDLETRLGSFSLKDPRLQYCSNIFDRKKAIQSNMRGDSHVEPNTSCCEDDPTTTLFDDSLRSGKYGLSEDNPATESVSNTSETLVQYRSGSRSELFKGYVSRYVNAVRDYQPVELVTERVVTQGRPEDVPPCVLTSERPMSKVSRCRPHSMLVEPRGRTISFSGSPVSKFCSLSTSEVKPSPKPQLKRQSRNFQTSRHRTNQEFLEEVITGQEIFKMKNLREKAVAYLLSATRSGPLYKEEDSVKTSARIDEFIGNQNVVDFANHRCGKCQMSFRLGTELRQHLRGHAYRQRSSAN